MSDLQTALLDLLHALGNAEIRLIIGGGYDADKEYGRYHALDIYTILATTTEGEWRHALELRDRCRTAPEAMEAGRLVAEHFSAMTRLGIVRLRESPYCRPELQLDEFMSSLLELFPAPDRH